MQITKQIVTPTYDLFNMINLANNFYFEFNSPEADTPDFLGGEFLVGRIKHKIIEKIFPQNKVNLFPVMPTRLDQVFLIQNLSKSNFFHNFEYMLTDWPAGFAPHLLKITGSFPNPLCLTHKKVFDAGVFDKQEQNMYAQIQTNPIYFIESLCTRRHIAHHFDPRKINCLGGLEDCLQWKFSHQKEDAPYLLTHGLLPWMSAQFLQIPIHTTKLEVRDDKTICRNILQFISQNKNSSALIVVDFQVLNTLDKILESINSEEELLQFIEEKIVYLNTSQAKQEPLFLSEPSPASCIEYSELNGFVSKKIIENVTIGKVENWLEEYKSILSQLFFKVSKKYTDWTKTDTTLSEQRDFFRFAYRLAFIKNKYFPDTFDLLLSAKSVINSNFAYELHKELQDFPVNPVYHNALKKIELPLNSFFDHTQKISLEKFTTIQSQKSVKKIKMHSVHKNRPLKKSEAVSEEKYTDNNWVNEDHPYSCSFPNEDIFMEKLAFDLKKNVQEKVKAKEQLHRELHSDFCDGLDLKETIRNWHKEIIIVKETLNVGKADIGAVIFGFAQPEHDERFSWRSFWLAEQHDDSHLMFYATPFKEDLIGPGIARSEFGGFAVIPLDSYIDNPWNHPYILTHAQNGTECLILAGALSSSHKSVLFISHHPPSQHIIKTLKQSGKNIIYARLDEFSQTDIRRVRTFHILAEAGVRAYAEKYIRKD